MHLNHYCVQATAAGGIASAGDMETFKRQQAMVQAGRTRAADYCVSFVALFPPRLLFCFVFSSL